MQELRRITMFVMCCCSDDKKDKKVATREVEVPKTNVLSASCLSCRTCDGSNPVTIEARLHGLPARAFQDETHITPVAEEEPAAEPAAEPSHVVADNGEYRVFVEKTPTHWSTGLQVKQSRHVVEVHMINPGLIKDWNTAHPTVPVELGDQLLEVNGVRGPTSQHILDTFQRCHQLNLVFRSEWVVHTVRRSSEVGLVLPGMDG